MASNYLAKGLKRSVLSLAIGLCFVGAAIAAESGGLRITITGNGGTPLAGATVKISSPSSLVAKTGVTAADGSISLNGLDPATNYTVEVVASGYSNFTASNVAVVSGKNLSVGYSLGATTLDTVVVTGASLAAVDTTSAVVSTTLTLDMVEALPTQRSYQSYLQLVPGVKPSAGGNPSSKSGVNYADIGGATGTSTDNTYYLDGVDVTDPNSGTFGANFNSEIIQEQQVLTGGIPAEYAGGSGLISKVVTKSGGDTFHGSINYYLQNDSLVSKNKHNTSNGFSTYDTAVTLGGPILKERLWFFGSYQKKSRSDDVVNAQSGAALRSVDTDSHYGFLKATWQITQNDRLTGEYFNDPFTRSGSTDPTVLNNRDSARKQGGDNYKLDYSHDWDNFRVGLYGFRHEAELATIPADLSTRNDVAYLGGNPTIAQRSKGGLGSALDTWNNRDEFGLNFEYWLDTSHGSHAFKMGYSDTRNVYKETSSTTGPDGARYASIAAANAGVTFQQFGAGGWSGTKSIQTADIAPRIIPAIMNSPDKAYFLSILDTDHDGQVSQQEMLAYKFVSTAGNPTGDVNNYRILRTQNAPYSVESTGKAFYLQDTWTMNQWTINAGVRTEQWQHFDSTGAETFKFKWKFAPRLSVVFDLNGDGRSKIWSFIGRYYDPIRTNMSDFAGALTGPVDAEQIYIGDRWLTFRTRGGATTPDAVFAPSTKTPYTDELMLGYATTFGQNVSLSVTYTHRKTADLLEDFDLGLYADPNTVPNDPDYTGAAGPGSDFYLPWSYFGYSSKPNSNYVIATLPGGKRSYDGFEITLQRQKSDNWQGMVSYTHNSAYGNSNSDSNADFQGDWIALDPRAPNMWGPQPGNIKHQFKAFGAYYFDFGLELSGVFNWNSGVLYNRSFLAYGRYLPEMQDDPTNVGGVYDTWVKPGSVGSQNGPSYYTLDLRAKYTKEFSVGKVEVFLDMFNILNKQSPISEMPLVNGNGVYAFGQANAWVEPRRAYLGVRYSF